MAIHLDAFLKGFSFQLTSEVSPYNLSPLKTTIFDNMIKAAISYIPIVNTIAYAHIFNSRDPFGDVSDQEKRR